MGAPWGFGIVRGSEHDSRVLFDDLCGAASAAAGVALAPFAAETYHELMEAIDEGAVGLAWLPPLPAIELAERGTARALAIPSRQGQTSYHSALVVRRGGPRTLEELRGRRAAWVQRDSAAGYLVPRMHLVSQGFDVLRFFARELFVHSHAGVVDAVVSGDADVGATFCLVDPKTREVMRAAWLDEQRHLTLPIEPLALMGPVPNDALVASTDLPATVRSALTRWLLALDDKSAVLFRRLLGAGDFRVPPPDHYDALEHMLRKARARGHDALPRESRMRVRLR